MTMWISRRVVLGGVRVADDASWSRLWSWCVIGLVDMVLADNDDPCSRLWSGWWSIKESCRFTAVVFWLRRSCHSVRLPLCRSAMNTTASIRDDDGPRMKSSQSTTSVSKSSNTTICTSSRRTMPLRQHNKNLSNTETNLLSKLWFQKFSTGAKTALYYLRDLMYKCIVIVVVSTVLHCAPASGM